MPLAAAPPKLSKGKKGKSSPYSIAERTVPELIPVLDGSQPAGDVTRRQAAITFRQACSYPRNP